MSYGEGLTLGLMLAIALGMGVWWLAERKR